MLEQVLNEPDVIPGVRTLEIDPAGAENRLLCGKYPQGQGNAEDYQ